MKHLQGRPKTDVLTELVGPFRGTAGGAGLHRLVFRVNGLFAFHLAQEIVR
ncbi:hypothetical protein AHiyo4_21160 [Arthrobacter sp. Hiyo4]|nr:hypothetical protein AHiyo4_21160 [Arthrobacter sp. Hiyo4]